MICFMRSKPVPDGSYPDIVAVLSGDLVASKQIGPAKIEAAMARLVGTADILSGMAGAETRFTRFRGDGWQIVLARAGLALRASLLIIAGLRASGLGVETRVSASIGGWSGLGTRDLSDASGEAFFSSGGQLDAMPGHRRLIIAGRPAAGGGETPDAAWQAAIFDLAEWVSARWSQPQAEAMSMALQFDWRTQDDLAQRLGITRQAMHARLTGAGYQALVNALAAFEGQKWDQP